MARTLLRRRRRRRRAGPGQPEAEPPQLSGLRATIARRLRTSREGGGPDEGEAERLSAHLIAEPTAPVTISASPAAPAQASPGPAPAAPAAAGPSSGTALSAPLRSRFSAALTGLDRVRIDTSPAAHRLTRGLGAAAVTLGPRIAFAPGRYAPGTPVGDRLLAHELVHTVQQARSGRAVQRAGEEKTASQGAVGVHGGLFEDAAEIRANVFVAAGESLTTIAARLLPYWMAAETNLPDEHRVALPPEIRTAPGLAKALLVYHQGYLHPPELPSWRAGLRLPLPMRVTQDGTRYVDVPRAAQWLGSFDAAWTPALTKPAAKAQPMQAAPAASPVLLATALLTNAEETAPAVLARLAAGDADAAAFAVEFLFGLVNHQIEVLNAQAPGRTVLARLRAVLEAQQGALAILEPLKVKRASVLLNAPFKPSDLQTMGEVVLGFKAQKGALCMEACYIRLGKLHGDAAEKDVRREVTRRDARTAANTDNVITIMQVLQDKGLAGPPITVTQATFDADFDRDPEGEVVKLIEQTGNRAGYYFFGMSVVTGFHSVILGVDNTNPGARDILWLDQNFKPQARDNWAGSLGWAIKQYAEDAEERSLKERGRSYGRYETQIWPLYPPSSLILPAK